MSIKYLDFKFNKNGRRLDLEHIAVIKSMPTQINILQLCSFLGLVNHYSSFLPKLHRVRIPVNKEKELVTRMPIGRQKDKIFVWIKLLTHYNPSLDITMVSDSSGCGAGELISCIFPNGSQKAIAVRSLTPAERNNQIEKEALTIIFDIKKFYKMLYGTWICLHYWS